MKKIIYQPKEFKPIKLEFTPISFYTPTTERKEQPIPITDLSQDTIRTSIESESKDDTKDNSIIWSNIFNVTSESSNPIPSIIKGITTYKAPKIDVGNLSDLLKQFENAGISLRVTSGKRPGAKTSNGSLSHHATGDAIDVTPGENETWESIIDKMKSNPTLLNYMRDNQWGILDERSQEMLNKTKGTGAHWHIGKDKSALSGFKTLFGRKGLNVPILKIGKSIKRSENITLENVDREDNEALNKYKETKYDPLMYSGTGNALQGEAYILNDKNIRETSDYDVYDYFKSYVNSEGYNRIMQNQASWWEKRHPYKTMFDFGTRLNGAKYLKYKVNHMDRPKIFELDAEPTESFLQGGNNNIYIGTNVNPDWPQANVVAHELAHAYNKWYVSNPEHAQGKALNQNKNTQLGHDSKGSEKHSDVWGLKYLLYKEGIYDSRSKEDVTPEQINKLREKYPKLRQLIQMTNDEAAWMLNHVASNINNMNLDNLT